MSQDEAEDTVQALARHLEVVLRPEHLAETAAAWRLMAPHLDRVRRTALGPAAEPASLFRP